MQNHEPKLCPKCPLTKAWKNEALKRLKERQYIKDGNDFSTLKICMERRKILRMLGLECPYFNYSFRHIPFPARPKRKRAKQTTLY